MSLAQRLVNAVIALCLALAGAGGPAHAGDRASGSPTKTSRTACIGRDYSYAGLESADKAYGVSGTLVLTAAPSVRKGHVAAWIGLGGMEAGPGDVPEWLQAGLVAFDDHAPSQLYYELVDFPNASYHEVAAEVRSGESHRLAVLEMYGRESWWRVWVDGRPVSPPIHLPSSHGAWKAQAVAENGNDGSGNCNGFSYEFSDLATAGASGGAWRPFRTGYLFQDPGYRVLRGATPTLFVARNTAVLG